jgi:hypothetical protein
MKKFKRDGFLSGVQVPVEGVQDTGRPGKRMGLGLKSSLPFSQDFEQVDGSLAEPGIVRFAHVDDDRFVDFLSELELLLQDLALVSLLFGFLDPVVIQADLSDGNDLVVVSSSLLFRRRARLTR